MTKGAAMAAGGPQAAPRTPLAGCSGPAARLNKVIARHFSVPRHQLRKSLSAFSEVIGRCDLLLDLGSGSDMPYRYLFRCNRYVGLDLFEPGHVRGDVQELPFQSASTDVVLCTEFFEHLPYPRRALDEVRRVLRPNGYLVMTVPLLWGEHDTVDFQRWTEAGLRIILSESGFETLMLTRRGAIFSSMGCLISQIPGQVFGTFAEKRPWPARVAFLLSVPLALIVPWLLMPLDPLDRSRRNVIGFCALCRKAKG